MELHESHKRQLEISEKENRISDWQIETVQIGLNIIFLRADHFFFIIIIILYGIQYDNEDSDGDENRSFTRSPVKSRREMSL